MVAFITWCLNNINEEADKLGSSLGFSKYSQSTNLPKTRELHSEAHRKRYFTWPIKQHPAQTHGSLGLSEHHRHKSSDFSLYLVFKNNGLLEMSSEVPLCCCRPGFWKVILGNTYSKLSAAQFLLYTWYYRISAWESLQQSSSLLCLSQTVHPAWCQVFLSKQLAVMIALKEISAFSFKHTAGLISYAITPHRAVLSSRAANQTENIMSWEQEKLHSLQSAGSVTLVECWKTARSLCLFLQVDSNAWTSLCCREVTRFVVTFLDRCCQA